MSKQNETVHDTDVVNEPEGSTKDVEGKETENNQAAEEVNQELNTDELLQKLTIAEQQADENYQKYLRAQADYDNLRRRTQQEKEAQAKYAALPLIEKLLPALDNFERALAVSKDANDVESLAKGIEMVYQQIEQALGAEGLETIPALGEKFDPNLHQAVMQDDEGEAEAGTITAEFQKGYRLKDKVIRPAMVKVKA